MLALKQLQRDVKGLKKQGASLLSCMKRCVVVVVASAAAPGFQSPCRYRSLGFVTALLPP